MGQMHDGVDEEIFAFANADAETARAWLSEAFSAQRDRGDPAALSLDQQERINRVLTLDWWQAAASDKGAREHSELLEELLPGAVRAASRLPLASVALAMYLRNLVNEAWELSWDHRLIRDAVNASVSTARGLDTEISVAWDLLDFMNKEFDVEAALLTGNLSAVIAITADAVAAVAPVRQAARELPAHPARSRLLAEARAEHRYYRAVHAIATATSDLLARRTANVDEEIDRIAALIDDGGFRAVDASELRGHLASVHTVRAATERDWVHIDEGRLRIVYGFGILHPASQDPASDLENVLARVAADQRAGKPLGPLTLAKVLQRLTLADVWQGTDTLGRSYRGSTFVLEDLVLERSDARQGEARPPQRIHTQVQLSELGNHAILFDIEIEDAAAFELAETINLATPVFGDLTEIPRAIRLHPLSDPGGTISRLADVVRDILDDLRRILQELHADAETDPIAARAGSFGVIVTVEQASRDRAGVRTPLTSAREILELWGAQPLLHPLPAGASGVADWTMYDTAGAQQYDLLHLNDELLTANSNVTLLASFRSPDYAIREIESFLTFAHSMHGMYQTWQIIVREHAERIAGLLTAVENLLLEADRATADGDDAAQERLIDDLGERVRVIERAELTLQSFVQSKQAIMLFVESPAIVSSPALRADLDTVLRSDGYHQLRTGFERAVRDVLGSRLQPLLDVCHRRIALVIESRQSARDRRTERFAQILGVVLAVIGLSGLVSVLQDGLGLRGEVTWWFLIAILIAAAALGLAMIVMPRGIAPRQRKRDRVRRRS